MKANPEIDELLNSFIDGELPPRQQTEVQRLIAHDPQVGQRLRQLQKCKMLLASLPFAEAPAGMLENIKAALEREALPYGPPSPLEESAGSETPVRSQSLGCRRNGWPGGCSGHSDLYYRRPPARHLGTTALLLLAVCLQQLSRLNPLRPRSQWNLMADLS